MPRPLRYFEPGSPVVITQRCFQSRFLLRPSKAVNALILGVVAMAQKRYGMKIHYLVVMSNHLHLYLSPESLQQLESFQRFLGSNLSKEVGREHGWRGGIFRSRYNMVNVTDEEEAQVGRLKYLVSHGVKEGLVRRPQDWPGIHAIKQLIKGNFKIRGGVWVDRSALHQAQQAYESNQASANRRVKIERPRRIDYTRQLDVELTPIPCWSHLPKSHYKEALRDMLEDIQRDHQEMIERVPKDWKKQILRRHPHPRPERTKRSTRPLCHAASREAWLKFRERFRDFVKAYLRASDLLRRGVAAAIELFPPGCNLPRLTERFREAWESPG